MECNKPEGCPTPLECDGDACCNEYVIETHELERLQSFEVTSQVYGEPLELLLRDIMVDITKTMGAVNRLAERIAKLESSD